MSDLVWHSFATRADLDARLADDVAAMLADAIARKGGAVLVVSGGSTPRNFFRALSIRALPWERVTVTLADERWVPPTHADSNERLVRENLLINHARSARFLSLWNAAPSAAAGAVVLDPQLARLGQIDVVILGMGGDGHTASLFPQAVALAAGLDLNSARHCIAVDPVAAAHARISLTLPRLLDAVRIIVHITGVEKKTLLAQAAMAADIRQWPIAAVLQQARAPVAVYWSD